MEEIDVDTWLDILGNPHRRKILMLLAFRPMYPQKIAEILGITPRAVINQLESLKKQGIVDRKERKRKQGGRDLLLYYVPRNAFLSLDIRNPSCSKVRYSKTEWHPIKWDIKTQIRPIDSEKKDFGIEVKKNQDFEVGVVKEIQNGLQELWKYHRELQELDNKRLELMRKREEQFNTISSHFEDKRLAGLIIMLYRVLLDRFGTTSYWTVKDVMEITNVDYDTAQELIRILEEEFHAAEFNKAGNPRNPSWQLKLANKPEYNSSSYS
ncbi:MAG: ArsR/SmtB family transcription factor [Promethearchaeota archaeon]